MRTDTLLQDLGGLRDALLAADLSLPLPTCDLAASTRDEAVAQIEDYLLPRLERLDAPLLAVVGGSTGSGKSTLTNSLIGEEVSAAGVLRPTTRAPVLVCNPADVQWFAGGPDGGPGVLPDLPRTTGVHPAEQTGAGVPGATRSGATQTRVGAQLHVVVAEAVPAGLGLLDSPDIDSVEIANHELATQMLGAADLWLFVTTAARYADAVPWRYLARASERAAAVALILNRVPPTPDGSALSEISADVRRMLDANGLPDALLFTIEEVALHDGRLAGAEDEIRRWIGSLVADAGARAEVIRRTLDGAVQSLPARAQRVLAGLEDQEAAVRALQHASTANAAMVRRDVAAQLSSGILLRGEVLDRFREQVGTAEWMHRLQQGVGRLRDRVRAAITGERVPVEAVKGQLRNNLVGLIDDAVTSSVERTVEEWQRLPGGATALGTAPVVAGDLAEIEQSVAAWQDTVVAMVREKAGSKLAVARGLSLGVNGIGVALMMTIFAATGGLTGGEVAVAGGTAAVSQALLSAVFGEQAVRDLATAARSDLLQRVEALTAARHDPLRSRLQDLRGGDQIEALRDAVGTVSAARR